jgi:thiosulfate reductase cytochrome b subunit
MKVSNGVDAHQLAIKSSAIRNCEACHQEGSAAFQNVTVSIPRPDGGTERYSADSDILNSVGSLSDFYAIGGTRIKLLDGLLILGLVGGLAVPVIHLTAGRLFRRRNDGKESAAAHPGQPIHTEPPQPDKLYINPLPVRIWHWLNALGFVLLVLSGAQLRYLDLFQLMTFEMAVKFHNWVGFAVIGNYFLWLGYYLLSDRISNYHPVLDAQSFFRNFFLQMRYYSYGIFKGEHSPHRVQPYDKFNPMQRMTYQLVMMVAVPIQFLTGLMLWNVKGFQGWIEMLGGIRIVAITHVLLFIFFASFILVHAYMGALGQKRSTHFKEMLTGYEEPED